MRRKQPMGLASWINEIVRGRWGGDKQPLKKRIKVGCSRISPCKIMRPLHRKDRRQSGDSCDPNVIIIPCPRCEDTLQDCYLPSKSEPKMKTVDAILHLLTTTGKELNTHEIHEGIKKYNLRDKDRVAGIRSVKGCLNVGHGKLHDKLRKNWHRGAPMTYTIRKDL